VAVYVVCYLDNKYHYKIRPDLNYNDCDVNESLFIEITRKYMHAETLADKTIVFSEREVFKVVVMVTQ
jgi:hypothetical protein